MRTIFDFSAESAEGADCVAERGIQTPETLSSLHAFQACALDLARLPLRADAIMHHVGMRSHLRKRSDSVPSVES
jgi:hypothetical protein